MLVLVEPRAGDGLEDDLVAAATVVATLAAEALAGVERVRALRESREELRRLASESSRAAIAQQRRPGARAARGHVPAARRGERRAPGASSACSRAIRTRRVSRFATPVCWSKQTLGELRELAQELRPSILEDFGYVQALRWYVGRLRERGGVAPALEVEEGEERAAARGRGGALPGDRGRAPRHAPGRGAGTAHGVGARRLRGAAARARRLAPRSAPVWSRCASGSGRSAARCACLIGARHGASSSSRRVSTQPSIDTCARGAS